MRYTEDLDDFLDDEMPVRRNQKGGRSEDTLIGWVLSRPGSAMASIVFVAMFGFVGSNALWNQPDAGTMAFFSTRTAAPQQDPMPMAQPEPQVAVAQNRVEPAAPAARPVVPRDPMIARVQQSLASLSLYEGAVDGISGGKTRQAIMDYQRILKLPQTGEVDAQLLALLTGAADAVASVEPERAGPPMAETGFNLDYHNIVASIVPTPRPDYRSAAPARPANTAAAPQQSVTTPVPLSAPLPAPSTAAPSVQAAPTVAAEPAGPDARIKLLQAGLRQFGNPDMKVDGMFGSNTEKAIREFQMIFRLPETGKPDEAVFTELRKQGYIN